MARSNWPYPVSQVDHARTLHYVGAAVAFPAGMAFACLQCVLTYRATVTALDFLMAHVRVAISVGSLISLVLNILPDRTDLFVRWIYYTASSHLIHG